MPITINGDLFSPESEQTGTTTQTTQQTQLSEEAWCLLQTDLDALRSGNNVIYSTAFSKWIVENITTCGYMPTTDAVWQAMLDNLQEAIDERQLDVTCLSRAFHGEKDAV